MCMIVWQLIMCGKNFSLRKNKINLLFKKRKTKEIKHCPKISLCIVRIFFQKMEFKLSYVVPNIVQNVFGYHSFPHNIWKFGKKEVKSNFLLVKVVKYEYLYVFWLWSFQIYKYFSYLYVLYVKHRKKARNCF